ncbi:MAG: addiction module protein [Planctomycetaceae bacterium]|nr:addiction module protein [Planctomycetaceae bacterium]
MISRDDILQQALALPPSDQAFVADMLERRIAESQPAPEDLGKSWTREIDQRIAAYQRGEMASLDFADSLQLLRQSITDHRSSRDAS